MKISFVCIWMKTNFHNKNFALSLAFIMRFKGTHAPDVVSLRVSEKTKYYTISDKVRKIYNIVPRAFVALVQRNEFLVLTKRKAGSGNEISGIPTRVQFPRRTYVLFRFFFSRKLVMERMFSSRLRLTGEYVPFSS